MTRARVGSAALLIALAYAATARGGDSPLPQATLNILTASDQSPTTAELSVALGDPVLPTLVSIATAGNDTDTGVELRAVHALALYTSNPSDQAAAHAALSALIGAGGYQGATSGPEVLMLRAAIETLGTVGAATNPEDVDALTPFLDHPSRDIRTSTARALRDLGFPSAVAPLRSRYAVETVPQVQLAISEALRVLQ